MNGPHDKAAPFAPTEPSRHAVDPNRVRTVERPAIRPRTESTSNEPSSELLDAMRTIATNNTEIIRRLSHIEEDQRLTNSALHSVSVRIAELETHQAKMSTYPPPSIEQAFFAPTISANEKRYSVPDGDSPVPSWKSPAQHIDESTAETRALRQQVESMRSALDEREDRRHRRDLEAAESRAKRTRQLVWVIATGTAAVITALVGAVPYLVAQSAKSAIREEERTSVPQAPSGQIQQPTAFPEGAK